MPSPDLEKPCIYRMSQLPSGEKWEKRFQRLGKRGRYSDKTCEIQVNNDSGVPWCISPYLDQNDCPVALQHERLITDKQAIELLQGIEVFNAEKEAQRQQLLNNMIPLQPVNRFPPEQDQEGE